MRETKPSPSEPSPPEGGPRKSLKEYFTNQNRTRMGACKGQEKIPETNAGGITEVKPVFSFSKRRHGSGEKGEKSMNRMNCERGYVSYTLAPGTRSHSTEWAGADGGKEKPRGVLFEKDDLRTARGVTRVPLQTASRHTAPKKGPPRGKRAGGACLHRAVRATILADLKQE